MATGLTVEQQQLLQRDGWITSNIESLNKLLQNPKSPEVYLFAAAFATLADGLRLAPSTPQTLSPSLEQGREQREAQAFKEQITASRQDLTLVILPHIGVITEAHGSLSLLKNAVKSRQDLLSNLHPDDLALKEALDSLTSDASTSYVTFILDENRMGSLTAIRGSKRELITVIANVYSIPTAALTEHIENRVERGMQAFVADVFHDVRRPLTSMNLALSLMGRMLSGEWTPALQLTLIERMAELQSEFGLVRDQMAQALSAETWRNRHRLNLVEINPYTFVQKEMDRIRMIYKDTDVTLKVELAEGIPSAEFDLVKLRAVLLNLVCNAFNHTPAGGIVTVSVSYIESQRSFQFQIADTGVGMDAETQAQIFDEGFTTLDANGHSGTGRGLKLAREYVVLHQGTLTLTSEKDKGTTFTILLPHQATE